MKTMALIAAAILTGCGAEPGPADEPAPVSLERDAATLANHRLDAGSLPEMRLIATPRGRDVLARVVSCALPRGAAITAITRDGIPYSFPGALGLAPGWAEHRPTGAERTRVIACVRSRAA
jgi:hypothetical protein